MSVVFINYPLETFTPTSSGALATIIWECCRVAEREGRRPSVITRNSVQPTFRWPETITIDYPQLPNNAVLEKILRAQRRLTGWRHLRQRVYAARVAAAIQKSGLSDRPFVLVNDPETAVFLRARFPRTCILHWFENQQDCSPRVRASFAKSVTSVCGVSDFTSRWISEYYQVSEVHTLYNGVDCDQFAPAARLPEGHPIINFVGRTGIEKAPDLLLEACILLAGRTRDFGLQLIGSNHWDRFELDDFQKRLQSLVDRLTALGIEVRRPGHVGRADLPAAFRTAHIHVVPSRWDEPFGLTTVEGMASGLAVVASNTGGTPEVVGDAGYLFERDSAPELAEHLFRLVSDRALLEERGRLARTRALEFGWERTWNGIKKLTGV